MKISSHTIGGVYAMLQRPRLLRNDTAEADASCAPASGFSARLC